jgi:translation initiation factor IF-2
MVTDGEILRNSMARIRRNGETVAQDRISSLRRYQEDASEVRAGFECGITMNNFNDLREGDVIEAYKRERVS